MTRIRVLDEFAPADVRSITELAATVEAATGFSPLDDDAWVGIHEGGGRGDRGVAIADGVLDAYAHLAHHHETAWSVELVIRPGTPDVRAELLGAVVDLAAAAGGGTLTLWLHDADDAGVAVAEGAGFAPDRELLQLRVALPLPDPPAWPRDVKVATFRPGVDEEAWVTVNNRAFAGHPEQGDWTVESLTAREDEPWFDPEGFLLAWDAEGVAGFCWTKVHPPSPPAEPDALGEIYVIGADPRRQGGGLGRALVTGGLASLAERGVRVGMLFVDGANAAAVGLYTALGFTRHRVDRSFVREVPAAAAT